MTMGWTRLVAGKGWVRDRCRMCVGGVKDDVDVGVREGGIQDHLKSVARTRGRLGRVGRIRGPVLDSRMLVRHHFYRVQPGRQTECRGLAGLVRDSAVRGGMVRQPRALGWRDKAQMMLTLASGSPGSAGVPGDKA